MNQGVAALFANGGVLPEVAAPLPVASEQVRMIPIEQLTDFPNQPFRPNSAEELEGLKQSILRSGILSPLIVRPLEGGYQIISGHNRRTAAKLAVYTKVPCVVRELSDDDALLQLIDTNLTQRTNLLPSEKARAYRLRLEAMNRQGERSDLTSVQVGQKLNDTTSRDALAQEFTDSSTQIQRYIRLTYLIPALLELVDRRQLAFTVGVSLSYLSGESQSCVHRFFVLDHPRALDQRLTDALRALPDEPITETALQVFLSPAVEKPLKKVTLQMKSLKSYFPPTTKAADIQKTILAALAAYFRERRE